MTPILKSSWKVPVATTVFVMQAHTHLEKILSTNQQVNNFWSCLIVAHKEVYKEERNEASEKPWLIKSSVICKTAINTGLPEITHLTSHSAGI